jgi:shikimate dehydrogenase
LRAKIHTAAYKALGLDYIFVCFEVEDREQTVRAIRALAIRGMSASMPYKSAVIHFVDRLNEAAEAIGAVNTIDHREGLLTGYNTDYIGAVLAFRPVN